MSAPSRPIVLAITGASGVVYGLRLLEVLLEAGCQVHLTISASGQAVIEHELGLKFNLDQFEITDLRLQTRNPQSEIRNPESQLTYHHYKDLMSPIASGSFLTAGMVICPCSGSTLGAVVHSAGENLVHRAAEVHLKERRKLILVPRETPLSLPQIENMKKATEAGAIVLPASPGFYHGAETVDELVDFVVARISDQLGVENQLMKRWGS